jgi:hypothetical protein
LVAATVWRCDQEWAAVAAASAEHVVGPLVLDLVLADAKRRIDRPDGWCRSQRCHRAEPTPCVAKATLNLLVNEQIQAAKTLDM